MGASRDIMTDSVNLDGIPAEEVDGFLAYRAKVAGTNISAQTLLATDYLNHFNEIIMLLEMVPDMPDCLDEAKEWQPKGYQDHFRDSTFSDRELAIEAYAHVPSKFRKPFEDILAQMNQHVFETIDRLQKIIDEGGHEEMLKDAARIGSRNVQLLMDRASAVIHGSDRAMDQSEIDGMLNG